MAAVSARSEFPVSTAGHDLYKRKRETKNLPLSPHIGIITLLQNSLSLWENVLTPP